MSSKAARREAALSKILNKLISAYSEKFNAHNSSNPKVQLNMPSEDKTKKLPNTIGRISKDLKALLLNIAHTYLTQVVGAGGGFSRSLLDGPLQRYEHIQVEASAEMLSELSHCLDIVDESGNACFTAAELSKHTAAFMRFLKWVAYQYATFYVLNFSITAKKNGDAEAAKTTKTFTAEMLFMEFVRRYTSEENFVSPADMEVLASVVYADISTLLVSHPAKAVHSSEFTPVATNGEKLAVSEQVTSTVDLLTADMAAL